jgi:hypothetical protein
MDNIYRDGVAPEDKPHKILVIGGGFYGFGLFEEDAKRNAETATGFGRKLKKDEYASYTVPYECDVNSMGEFWTHPKCTKCGIIHDPKK